MADNPFLPAAVRNRYLAAGESTVFLGRQNTDEGVFSDRVRESVEAFTTGLRARLGGTWLLRAHASYGQADTGERWENIYSIDRFMNAVDAVTANGRVTCRINAVTVTDPACAPANIFGAGNMSAEAKAYFLGNIEKPMKTEQREVAVDFTAEPFAVAAGLVSIAFGANHREEARQLSSAVDGEFAFTGYPAFSGETRVSEVYAQTVVPLFRDNWLARSVEAELAARWVHYSQAGSELPWKLGLNWTPIDGVRLRASSSEDIRAPNILERDLPQFQSSISPQVNPLPNGLPIFNSLGFAPGQILNVREIGGGNPNLTPEVARTTTVGVVFQPEKSKHFSIPVS